jgi:hypothetical protein
MTDVASCHWHVLTVTEGGTVSLIRNVPLALAVDTWERLDPWRRRREGVMYPVNAGDIKQREILGPPDWDGCHKAEAHAWTLGERRDVTEGPRAPFAYRTDKCVHCGQGKMVDLALPDSATRP